MMGGVSPETCWTIKKQWNNRFYYTVASCWFFLWALYYDARIHEHQDTLHIQQVVRNLHSVTFVRFEPNFERVKIFNSNCLIPNPVKITLTVLEFLQVDAVHRAPIFCRQLVVTVTNTFATRIMPTEPLALRDFTRVPFTRRQDPTDTPRSLSLTALFSTATRSKNAWSELKTMRVIVTRSLIRVTPPLRHVPRRTGGGNSFDCHQCNINPVIPFWLKD
jgi:hypothetical protein